MRGAASIALIALLVLTACLPTVASRKAELWRLPDNYKGWIYVEMRTENVPPWPYVAMPWS